MQYQQRLYTPGPTPIPPEVSLAMAQPIRHHRTTAFAELLGEVADGLRRLYQTSEEVLILSGTGTAAMEAAVTNFLSPGDTAIFVNGGRFGERFGKILQAYGMQAVAIDVPWGQAVQPEKIAQTLQRYPHCKAVYVQACETSTGTEHPVKEIAELCHAHGDVLCIVDAITALGVWDIAQDRDAIDVLLSASQKALMLPPGLAFVGVSQRAWRHHALSRCPRYYLDLALQKAAQAKRQTAWTSSVSLLNGLQVVLRLLHEEGLSAVFKRHAILAKATQQGILAMGWQLASNQPARGLTCCLPPLSLDAAMLKKKLASDYGIEVGGGQGEWQGKVIRIAHMGYFDGVSVLAVLSALEALVGSLQPARVLGMASAAAQKILGSNAQ